VAGPVLAACALLAANQIYAGSPFTFPVDQYFDGGADWGMRWRTGCNRLGLGPDRGCLPGYEATGYTFAMAREFFRSNLIAFDRLLLGFPGGALLVMFGAARLVERKALPWAVIVAAIAPPLACAAYWYHGICYGARFWHPAYLLAIPAAAVVLGWKPKLGVAALLAGVAWTVPQVWRELADDYWCVPSGLDEALAQAGVTDGVVLLDARGHDGRSWPLTKHEGMECSAWHTSGAGLGQDDPFGGDRVTFLRAPDSEALDQPGADDRAYAPSFADIVAAHPDTAIWYAHADVRTGKFSVGKAR
jgi:hypothetical protein